MGRVKLFCLAKEGSTVVHGEGVARLGLWAGTWVDLVSDSNLERRWRDFGGRHDGHCHQGCNYKRLYGCVHYCRPVVGNDGKMRIWNICNFILIGSLAWIVNVLDKDGHGCPWRV